MSVPLHRKQPRGAPSLLPNRAFVADLLRGVTKADLVRVRVLVEAALFERGEERRALDPPATKPLKIFLCHATNDKPAVRRLYRRLRDDGHEPWLDEVSLFPGQRWEPAIQAAVKASDIAVVCLSRLAIEKTGFVQAEIREILEIVALQPHDRIFLVPVRLEDCEIPAHLRVYHWVDLFRKSGYRRLGEMLAVQSQKVSIRQKP